MEESGELVDFRHLTNVRFGSKAAVQNKPQDRPDVNFLVTPCSPPGTDPRRTIPTHFQASRDGNAASPEGVGSASPGTAERGPRGARGPPPLQVAPGRKPGILKSWQSGSPGRRRGGQFFRFPDFQFPGPPGPSPKTCPDSPRDALTETTPRTTARMPNHAASVGRDQEGGWGCV